MLIKCFFCVCIMKMTILNEICCICVQKHETLRYLNEPDDNNTTYNEKLQLLTPLQNWADDFKICKVCLEQLNAAFSFVKTCEQSEKLREQIIEEESKVIDEDSSFFDEQFGCDLCGRYFKLKRTLKLHITRIHNVPVKKVKRDKTIKVIDVKVLEITDQDLNKTETEDLLKSETELDFADNNDNGHYSSEEDVKKTNTLGFKKNWSKRKVPLKCEYCGKSFNRRQHWSAHVRSKHTFEKPYECDLCDAKFTNSHSLLVHKRNHNNEKPFVCTSCGKTFVCSGDLYHHSKIHLNKREYKCSVCHKSFNTTSILRTHKICMHTDPSLWKYICHFCNRRFPINSSLATHMKRHIGVKEFSCHICEKQFFDKPELTKHIRSHTNERLFKCEICEDKEYKNRYGLRKHLKLIHNIGDINISKPVKKYLCPMCPKIFAFNNKLQKHIFTHTGEKPFKCDFCEKKFVDNYYRKVHVKKKHNIDIVDNINEIS